MTGSPPKAAGLQLSSAMPSPAHHQSRTAAAPPGARRILAARPHPPRACRQADRPRRARAAVPHARAPAVELDVCARRDRLRRHDRHRQGAARRAWPCLHAGAPGDRHRAGLARRHAQMAAPPCRRQGGRDRLHPRGGSRHALHFEPGRLHAQLQLLPYRHATARAQPHARRDRGPDHDRARPHRRLAGRLAPTTRAGCRTASARSPMSC